jgi:hypothetical protein
VIDLRLRSAQCERGGDPSVAVRPEADARLFAPLLTLARRDGFFDNRVGALQNGLRNPELREIRHKRHCERFITTLTGTCIEPVRFSPACCPDWPE